jgi:hypothetical protein
VFATTQEDGLDELKEMKWNLKMVAWRPQQGGPCRGGGGVRTCLLGEMPHPLAVRVPKGISRRAKRI